MRCTTPIRGQSTFRHLSLAPDNPTHTEGNAPAYENMIVYDPRAALSGTGSITAAAGAYTTKPTVSGNALFGIAATAIESGDISIRRQ